MSIHLQNMAIEMMEDMAATATTIYDTTLQNDKSSGSGSDDDEQIQISFSLFLGTPNLDEVRKELLRKKIEPLSSIELHRIPLV